MALALSCFKTCNICGEDKSEGAFAKNRNQCRDCMRERDRLRYQQNRETKLAQARRYYREHAEERKAYAREHRKTYDTGSTRERRLARERKRYHANPDHERERSRRYYEANYDKWLDYAHARREQMGTASPEVQAFIREIRTLPCVYCGSEENIEVDHVVPLSRGGEHSPENLAPACLPCNRSKGARTLDEWHGRDC